MKPFLPDNTKLFLSSLMEEKINSHPSDWGVYFKDEYKKKFVLGLMEADSPKKPEDEAQKRAREEQEALKRELEEIEAQQKTEEDQMMLQADENIKKSKKAASELLKNQKSASKEAQIGGGFGAGAPGKGDLEPPSIGDILLGDTDKAGQYGTVLGPLAGVAAEIGGSALGAALRPFIGGAKLQKFSQKLGQTISDILGGRAYIETALDDLSKQHTADVLSGAGHKRLSVPVRADDPWDYWRAERLMR